MNQNKHNQYSQLASKEHARRPQTQDMPHITARISSLVTPAINDTYKPKRQEGLSHHQALRESLTARKEDTKNESDYNLLTTVELVGDFVEASHELNELRDEEDHRPLQYSEKQYKKRLLTDHIIPFNHSIKELINTDPSFTIVGGGR